MREIDRLKNEVFGLSDSDFKPLQLETIEAALDGKRIFLTLPTGQGKSLTFQIPALMNAYCHPQPVTGPTLVISPLRALIHDQQRLAADVPGMRAAALHGDVPAAEFNRVLNELPNFHLVFLTPEQLVRSSVMQVLKATPPARFVFDEAHCITEWGRSFRPKYRQACIVVAREFPDIPWTAMTATAPLAMREEVLQVLTPPVGGKSAGKVEDVVVLSASSYDRPNLFYEFRQKPEALWSTDALAANKHRDYKAIELVGRDVQGCPCAIVFCTTRGDCDAVKDHLTAVGVSCAVYHGGLSGKKRAAAQMSWLGGAVNVLVATSAFAMGVNHPCVRKVIHLSPPLSLSAYIQQTGRAGRDGAPAECVLYFNQKYDVRRALYMLEGGSGEKDKNKWRGGEASVKAAKADLMEMVDVCAGFFLKGRCVRRSILEYVSGRDLSTGAEFGNKILKTSRSEHTARSPSEEAISEMKERGSEKGVEAEEDEEGFLAPLPASGPLPCFLGNNCCVMNPKANHNTDKVLFRALQPPLPSLPPPARVVPPPPPLPLPPPKAPAAKKTKSTATKTKPTAVAAATPPPPSPQEAIEEEEPYDEISMLESVMGWDPPTTTTDKTKTSARNKSSGASEREEGEEAERGPSHKQKVKALKSAMLAEAREAAGALGEGDDDDDEVGPRLERAWRQLKIVAGKPSKQAVSRAIKDGATSVEELSLVKGFNEESAARFAQYILPYSAPAKTVVRKKPTTTTTRKGY